MKVSLLLFIMCQGGILSIVCFSFLQFKQIRMDFWYPWNLTYQIDKNSIQYRNQIHQKSKLKCELIPNSEGPCSSEASVSDISTTSFFAFMVASQQFQFKSWLSSSQSVRKACLSSLSSFHDLPLSTSIKCPLLVADNEALSQSVAPLFSCCSS